MGGESSTWSVLAFRGRLKRQTKEVRRDQCWAWLQNGGLKRETESLIVAAQNQSVRTNLVQAKIDKSQEDFLYRVCRKVDENIILLLVLVNLRRRSTREGMIMWGKLYIGSLLKRVILKLEINGMNMSQKLF